MSYTNIVTSERNRKKDLVNSPITLSSTLQNIGEKIDTRGLINIALWFKGLLNDSDKVVFRCKCYPTKDSSEYYYTQIQTVTANDVSMANEEYSFTTANFNIVVPLGISQLAPYIQIEAKVNVEGATPAEIEKALITFEREKI